MGRRRSSKWDIEELVYLIRAVDLMRDKGASIRLACEVIARHYKRCSPETVRTHYYQAEKMGLRSLVPPP